MTKKLSILILALISIVSAFDIKDYEPKQITTSSSKESNIVIKDDNTIYFASDRTGNFDVYKKDLVKESEIQITFQPSNEYPLLFDGRIIMESDETDIYGNLYYLSETGSQELLFSTIGREYNPSMRNGKLYFCEKRTEKFMLRKVTPGSNKKPRQVRDGIGERAVIIGENDLIYQSDQDATGYSNLYMSYITAEDSSGNSEPVQVTFGQKIITGFDVSKDEKTIVYSAVTTDTNGDGKLDLNDNSILYRIKNTEEGFSDPFQLTSETYSSHSPRIASDGKIFFISDRKGNDDIWLCGTEGVAPYKNNPAEQKELSDYLLENYKARVLLSEAMNENISEETKELLSNALLSYYRTITFSGQTDEEKAEAYFRIAEIYEIQGKYRMAESIYRILQNRFQNSESISGSAELKRVIAELKRRDISTSEFGYELDEHLRYLNTLTEKYKDEDIRNLVFIRIGEIYYDMARYPEANSYFLKAKFKKNGTENSESYFWMAKSAFMGGNIQTAGGLLEKAISSAVSDDEKEKYIREYFKFSDKSGSADTERITGTILDEKLPPELRSYAGLILGITLDDPEMKIENFSEVKRYYVENPENILLKKFSAQADIKLADIYTETGPEEAVESILLYMIANYKGINYDLYSLLAQKRLSGIYQNKAKEYLSKKMSDNALLSYTKAYELDKTSIEVIRGIVDSYSSLKKINEAINLFTAEYDRDQNNAYLNYALGYAYSVRGTSGVKPEKGDITEAARLTGRSIEIDSNIKYAYLTLSYCYEALYHIGLEESEEGKNRNAFLKALDFIIGPLKFILESVNIIEDSAKDYTDLSISLLGKGMGLCDKEADRELYIKMKLNLANNYYNMGEYARKQALDYYLQVINEGYTFSSRKQEAIIFERTGHCLFTLDDESAEDYYSKALDIYKELNDRKSELRVSMRTALLYLTREDKEGDLIGGDDAYQKYADIIIKLKSEDNQNAINLIKRNSAFARFVDEEYAYSSELAEEIIDEDLEYKDRSSKDNLIVLSLLGLEIPVWKLDIILGSQYSEGFEGKDELALIYSINASSYSNLKDFKAVKEILKSKAEIFKKKGNDLALSLIENRLGVIEYLGSDWKESIRRFERSNELCLKMELYNVALVNENNILKAMIMDNAGLDQAVLNNALNDTTVYNPAIVSGELTDRAVNRNLRGILCYNSYKKWIIDDPAEKYKALRYLVRAEKFFNEADSLLSSQARTNEEKNRISASVGYNLALTLIESGNISRAKEVLHAGNETAKSTYDKLLHWRFMMKAGDFETDPDEKFKAYLEAEKTLSEYLPSTADYELISGWREDIKPLYDRLIESCLQKNDIYSAMNYAERFKNRTLLNYYSSRYLDYKEQLHKIHIKKIRYNNEEIVRYRQKADLLKNKNPEKYAKLIAEYEQQADFYEKELNDIYDQIRKSNDERLLQFVSIEDINSEQLCELMGEYTALISVYSLPGSELFFYFDGNEAKLFKGNISDFTQVFDGFAEEIKEKEHIFIIPDNDQSVNADYNAISRSKGLSDINFTLLPTISSLKMAYENANINYTELKTASEADVKEADIPASLENGGILYIDKPVEVNGSNALENTFLFGKNKVKTGDLLKLKIPAYAVVIEDFNGDPTPLDKIILVNSLIFSGAQSVILPENIRHDTLGFKIISRELSEKSSQEDIISILKGSGKGFSLFGLTGMDKEAQREFALSNLKTSLTNGVRYFNSKVYEKAAVYFIQALAMARNTGDKQELNILKTLITSLRSIKDYKRAIIYGGQLVSYTEKNGLESEKLSALDELSKNYFRNKQYDESIVHQEKILNDRGAGLKEKLAAYDMLSIIYSYKGDLKRSIQYKKEYMRNSGLITSDEISSFREELDGKTAEVLFNSLRNIMVSYYKNGEIDSALFVYQTIIDNKTEFENVNFDSFGELLESAGLCYFRKSDYKKAEELYFEAIEYFTEDEKKSSVYLNLSDMYYYSDKLSSALKYLADAEKLSLTDPEKMRAYNTRSLIEIKLDDLPAASTYSYKALEKTIEINDRSEESTARVNLAKILILSGEIPAAQKNLDISMKLAGETGNIKARISAEFYKGEIYQKNVNNPDSALSCYQRSLKLAVSGSDEYFKARSLYRISETYFSKLKYDSCEIYANRSLEAADKFNFGDVYLESAYKLSEIYEKDQPVRALEILEKLSKKAIKISEDNENQFPEDQEWTVRSGYSKRLNLLIKNLQAEKAISLIIERDNLFISNDLKYFDYKYEKIKPKISTEPLKDIQNSLNDASAVLMFLPYGGSSYILTVKKNSFKTFMFSINKEIAELPSRIETKSDFTGYANKAYQTVFTKELSDELSGVNNLYIYSDGVLKNYPFEVLYDGQNFLIDEYNIAEVNDLNGFDPGTKPAQMQKSLSFVNPFTAESELVYAEREYSALSRINKTAALTEDKKATETLFKNDGLNKYSMLHLPVHSFVISKDSVRTSGRSSYIQLSADESNDGRLEWSEIIGLVVENKEIILSGCDTGGKTGEDYFANFDLSYAFGLSGAGTVISSKWRTDDLAASVLMKRYFRYSAAGEDRISALSKAKRDVRAYFNPHPYYWANFKINK